MSQTTCRGSVPDAGPQVAGECRKPKSTVHLLFVPLCLGPVEQQPLKLEANHYPQDWDASRPGWALPQGHGGEVVGEGGHEYDAPVCTSRDAAWKSARESESCDLWPSFYGLSIKSPHPPSFICPSTSCRCTTPRS